VGLKNSAADANEKLLTLPNNSPSVDAEGGVDLEGD
jgi:hypothetical protein